MWPKTIKNGIIVDHESFLTAKYKHVIVTAVGMKTGFILLAKPI